MAAAVLLAVGGGYVALRERAAGDGEAETRAAGATSSLVGELSNSTEPSTGSETRRDLELGVDSESESEPEPAALAPQAGILAGILVDDDGRPVANVKVEARSSEGAGKARSHGGVRITDANGSFHDDFLPLRSDFLWVKADTVTDVGRVKIHRNTADRAGEYTLAAMVHDDAGRPLPGAWVRIYRGLASGQESGPPGPWEAGAEVDATGSPAASSSRTGPIPRRRSASRRTARASRSTRSPPTRTSGSSPSSGATARSASSASIPVRTRCS
jgi:protocatechuate 3,4-dioxygenase beta subunit